MSEYFDIVDLDDKVIGQASRSECHRNPDLVHRAVHVLVFNSRDELYLQRRAWNKDIQPGKWDTSVGGHVTAGEEWDVAAQRELEEELGVESVNLQFVYSYLFRNEIESERIRTYILKHDGEIEPNPLEIIEGRFWGKDEIEASLGSGIFTPNFEVEFENYLEWRNGRG
jgi:isopentenyl-diphosphate delta-isomerase type 1